MTKRIVSVWPEFKERKYFWHSQFLDFCAIRYNYSTYLRNIIQEIAQFLRNIIQENSYLPGVLLRQEGLRPISHSV